MSLTPEQIERERELFGRWFREHYDIPLIRNSRAEAAWLARAEIAAAEREWRPIEEAPKGKCVLVHYENEMGKSRIAHAVYIERFTEESCEDFAEYCEEKDAYYTPEGWYEICQNYNDFSSMAIYEGEPDLWMPLPAPPQQEKGAIE